MRFKKKILLSSFLGVFLFANGVYAGSKLVDYHDSPFRSSIELAIDKGFMKPIDKEGNFGPKQLIDREHLAEILVNYEKSQRKEDMKVSTELDALEQEVQKIKNQLKADSDELLSMVANTMKSVVRLETNKGTGSGVFVDETTILTAYHVVEGTSNVTITLPDYRGTIKGMVIETDTWNDLAVVKIDNTLKNNNYQVRPITLATKEPRLGETVFIFGSPKGMDFSVTKGIVSNLDRVLSWRSVYQFDAIVHPGYSGGPLVNERGELTGIVVGVLNEDGKTYDGISFAVNLSAIKNIVNVKQ